MTTEIFMPLLDEGVDVWRPIEAEHVGGKVYRVPPMRDDQREETWKFAPGETVICEMIESASGKILAAVRRAA